MDTDLVPDKIWTSDVSTALLERTPAPFSGPPAGRDHQGVAFLQWALPRLRMRWRGFRKPRRQVLKSIRRRLGRLGLSDLPAYQSYLERHPAEWRVLDRFCRISISRFYRDRDVFDYLRDQLLPEMAGRAQTKRRRKLRFWSAGCASGEEPYTLAILWRLCVGPRFPKLWLQITATDSHSYLLFRARRRRYAGSSIRDMDELLVRGAFIRNGEEYQLRVEFRQHVMFFPQDIRRKLPDGVFDLVLCRHMAFTYFDEALQRETLDRILRRLRPGGYLVIAKKESLPEGSLELEAVSPRLGIYRRV